MEYACKKPVEDLPEKVIDIYGRTPTFPIISDIVQSRTNMRLLRRHLAEIKYIPPEAVRIDNVFAEGEHKKSVLKIGLLFDVVVGHGGDSVFVALCILFDPRLREFHAAHPEEPFDTMSYLVRENRVPKGWSSSRDSENVNLSHSPCPPRRWLSEEAVDPEIEMTNLRSHLKSACVIYEENERTMPLSSYASTAKNSLDFCCLDGQDTNISPMEICDEDS